MTEIRTLSILTPRMRDKVIKAWRGHRVIWKYGIVKPRYDGVGIYIKGGILRNYIPSKVIAEYLAEHKSK